MVTILAFIVLGGGAYAAFRLPRNVVRSKNIVNGQVKARDLTKPQPVKSAGLAASNGNCMFTQNQWTSYQAGPQAPEGPVGYYRDADAQVHLNGTALRCGN